MKRRHFFRSVATSVLGLAAGKEALGSPAQTAEAEALEKEGIDGKVKSAWRFYKQPYQLSKGPHLFTDWRYVDPGRLHWMSSQGEALPLRGAGPFVEAEASHRGMAQGVVIRAQPAQISEPVERVWPGTLIHEGGRYRLWYALQVYRAWYLPELADQEKELHRIVKSWTPPLLYAESDDGFNWKIPDLKLVKGESHWKNVVFGGEVAKKRGLHQPGIFVDPSAPASERYKMIHGGRVGGPGREDEAHRILDYFRRERPNELDPFALRFAPDELSCVFGATSPDGLHWTPISEPLTVHFSDTANNGYYDQRINKYVWYGRINSWFGRRSIARSETSDFRRFPFPDLIIRPSADNAPYEGWYTNAKTIYPGSSEEHLMFPVQFRRSTEYSAIHLYSSPDGIYWDPVPGGPVITKSPFAQEGDSWMRAWGNLVELPNQRVGLMVDAELLPHKYPRRAGELYRQNNRPTAFWAWWPKGRLAAIEADQEGAFTTPQLTFEGRKLVLNLKTRRAGEVRIEVVRGSSEEAIPGHTFDDCDPIHGDSMERTVTWRGGSDLGHRKHEPVRLRFQVRQAKLFSFEIRS